MAKDDSARDQLTKRELVQMTLSEPSNSLTGPAKLPADLSPEERARRRFAVEGNAIVTGGSGGIGLVVIRALLEHGASGIAIFDVPGSLATSQEAINALRTDFPNARIITVEVDVRDEARVESAVQEAVTGLGSVNMLLCLAGVVQVGHAHEMAASEWRRVLDVNTTGSWFCAQAAAKQMIAQNTGGSIVFTASISAHHANFPQPQVAYNTSKGAILQLTRSLAAEWARFGIRVNSISPGYMDTILNHGEGLEACRRIWTSRNPMGRMGDPEELVGAVVLLCSPVVGKYLTVDSVF
ncbi:short chain dehydrogenase reductase family [Moniliophthora roreri MCA 2997]|uniref:Short chain dehydrogenase reductase family n=1 Tax=Moniliophthora roreri (strain MCA 2997) TaxID=1381753 RepID=V2XHG4_MONRO|nr:short chain dehydrogenase reductase family [Moniliophthora roreri MCA 2997]